MCMAKTLSLNLVETVNIIREVSRELNEQLSTLDKTIIDLQHEIEFGKFDVFRGYKKLKQLQDVLIERREVKNEWELIQPLIRYTGNLEDKVNEIHNIIIEKESKHEYRQYTPRVLKNIS